MTTVISGLYITKAVRNDNRSSTHSLVYKIKRWHPD